MNVNNASSEDPIEEIDVDSTSVDDFIKELEEKEKDLDISSDLVIEIGESEVEHDNIHDSFVANISIDNEMLEKSLTGELPPLPVQQVVKPKPSNKTSKEVSKLTKDIVDLKDTLIRRQRDFDNYRNRTERVRTDTFRNVVSNVAAQMLPVMDNLNRALDAFSSVDSDEDSHDMKTFHEGIILVNQQLNEVLSSMGVKPISAIGEPFDPNYHEAVASEETDDMPPETVIEEILKGYRIDDKIIRPSMVKVSASKLSTDSQTQNTSSPNK